MVQRNQEDDLLWGMSVKTAMWGFIAFVGTIFTWEHVARVIASEIKPSVFMTHVAKQARLLFEWIGTQWGRLSKFITYLKLENLFQTFEDLSLAFLRLVTAPLYALKGYFEVISDYKWPLLICLGSAILLGLLVWAGIWIKGRYFSSPPVENKAK